MGNRPKNPNRNQEPIAIETTITGHATGNYNTPPDVSMAELAERVRKTGLIYADQDDHGKEEKMNRDSGPAPLSLIHI